MTAVPRDLPEGRRGQMVAVGLLLAVLGLAWTAVAAPLLDWYAARAEHLAEQQLLLAHQQRLVQSLPTLRQQAGADRPAAGALLSGESDAIAGAALQGAVRDMATAAGATLSSTEVLPGEQQGGFRRIALRVTLTGDWPVLVALLRAVDESPLRLLVDDLQLHVIAQLHAAGPPPLDASFVVLGFRPGRAAPAPQAAAL